MVVFVGGGSCGVVAINEGSCHRPWGLWASVGAQPLWVGCGYPGHSIFMGGGHCCPWALKVCGVVRGCSRFVGGVAVINGGIRCVVSCLWAVVAVCGGLRLSVWVVVVVCGQLCSCGSCSFGCGQTSSVGPHS